MSEIVAKMLPNKKDDKASVAVSKETANPQKEIVGKAKFSSNNTEHAATFVKVNLKDIMNEDGWIIKDGKGFRVVCGGSNTK